MNLTTEGIIFWILGWGIVIGMVIFCFYKIMKSNKENNFNQD